MKKYKYVYAVVIVFIVAKIRYICDRKGNINVK